MSNQGTYTDNNTFTGIFVTQKARVTRNIIPNVVAVYVPLGEANDGREYFAWCPNNYGGTFYHWQFQESLGKAQFNSPLLYILSAN